MPWISSAALFNVSPAVSKVFPASSTTPAVTPLRALPKSMADSVWSWKNCSVVYDKSIDSGSRDCSRAMKYETRCPFETPEQVQEC